MFSVASVNSVATKLVVSSPRLRLGGCLRHDCEADKEESRIQESGGRSPAKPRLLSSVFAHFAFFCFYTLNQRKSVSIKSVMSGQL